MHKLLTLALAAGIHPVRLVEMDADTLTKELDRRIVGPRKGDPIFWHCIQTSTGRSCGHSHFQREKAVVCIEKRDNGWTIEASF